MNLRFCTLNSRKGLKPDIKNELLRGAFRIRYEVYHDELSWVPKNPARELHDEYDFIEPTSIFLVLDGSKPVGTMRLIRYSEEYKLPIFKNFEKKLISMFNIYDRIREGRKFAEPSRFTVIKAYRPWRSYVLSILICMMYDRCVEEGITDFVIVVYPGLLRLYKKGAFKVFGVKKDLLTGIEKSPVMHAEVNDGFEQLVKWLKFSLKRNQDFTKIFDQSNRIKHEVVNL